MEKQYSKFKINFLAFIACFIWSTAFATVKYGLMYLPPFTFAGLRFIIAGIMLFFFIPNKKNIIFNFKLHFKIIFKIALLQTFILYSIFFYSMTLVQGAITAIIIGSSPIITAIMTHFLMKNEKLNLKKVFILLLGLIGIIIISINSKPWTSNGLKTFFGIILLLIGTVSSTFANITIAKEKKCLNPIELNAQQLFWGGVFLFILSLFIENQSFLIVSYKFWLALIWLAFISSFSFSIWFKLLTIPNISVSALNVWKFVIPVCGATISWILIKNETPDIISIIGLICISLSVFFYNKSNK